MPRSRAPTATQEAHKSAHQRILACKKDKKWSGAIDILSEARDEGSALGTVSYNAAIDACGKARQVVRALELFDELVRVGNVPDAVTYTALIDACGRAGLLDQAFALFNRCARRAHPRETPATRPPGRAARAAFRTSRSHVSV